MKKILIALFVISAFAMSMYAYGFDLNLKKKSCETACNATYDECMKSAQKEYEQGKDQAVKLAKETSCAAAKEECYRKCNK